MYSSNNQELALSLIENDHYQYEEQKVQNNQQEDN